MRSIKDHLQEAVSACMKAAGHEFEPKTQRALMKAASFGKSFLKDMRPQAYVEMSQTVRVLNNVRNYKVGIPLTFEELQRLSLPVLIDRLVLRRHYLLAIKICDYLRIPKRDGASRILAHWACHKVQQSNIDDELLAKEIAAKLGDTPGISYIDIAYKALDQGKKSLAVKLLDYEPKASNQVPLLLRMEKFDLALQKASDSGDMDQVYMVIERVDQKSESQRSEFLRKIRNYPMAQSLLIKKCKLQEKLQKKAREKEESRNMLAMIFFQDDQFRDNGNTYIQYSYDESDFNERMKLIEKAKMNYESKGMQLFTFGAQVTADQLKLLEFQKRLQKPGEQYMNLSLYDTLYQLIYKGCPKQAETLRKEFNISDTRFWWKKMQALAAASDWVELEKFSKSKKSPIGYEPFVEVCLTYGHNLREAEKYMQKVPVEKRIKLYIKMGDLNQAAEAAFQVKSVDDLNALLSKCANNRELTERIQARLSQLTYRR